jgi:hypothetical protein
MALCTLRGSEIWWKEAAALGFPIPSPHRHSALVQVAPSGDPLGHLAGEGRDGCHCIPSSSRPACKTGQEFSQQKALSCLNCLDFTDKNDFSHIKITAKARQKYSLVEFFSVFVLFCIVPHYYFL